MAYYMAGEGRRLSRRDDTLRASGQGLQVGARACWRMRSHYPLEFSGGDPCVEADAGPGFREYGGIEAEQLCFCMRFEARRDTPRGRYPEGSFEPCSWKR